MDPLLILIALRAEPPCPLRVHLDDGSSYDVSGPVDMAVTRPVVWIGLEPNAQGVPTRSVEVAPGRITRIERNPFRPAP